MTTGLVVVPLLVGYWIVWRTHYFKPTLAQTPAYAFLLQCAVIGLIHTGTAVFLSWACCRLTECNSSESFRQWWDGQISLENPSTAIFLLISALVIPFLVNAVVTRNDVARKWFVANESPLDRSLREAFEARNAVEVALESGLSYVGLVKGPSYPWEWPEDIRLIHVFTGHPEPNGKRTYRRIWPKRKSTIAIARSSVASISILPLTKPDGQASIPAVQTP